MLPYVHPEGARKYIDFLKRAFGAEEMAVIEHSGRSRQERRLSGRPRIYLTDYGRLL